jgi:lipopolysaccharide export system protein LptC
MTGKAGNPVGAFDQRTDREVAPIWPRSPQPALRSRSPRADDRYSRRVVLLKRALPVLGMTLLTLVAIWPRLGPLLETVRLGFSVIDLREARELRMLNPRYAGVDRFNRPYVVTSAVGRQVPNRDDLMSLERPRAEMIMHRGALVVVTATTAMYQSRTQLLDLFGEVNLVHENGTRFVTKTAHVDLSVNTAEGHDPVSGHGPSGDITAQGFRILDKGDTIIFTGTSNLLLKGTKPTADPAIKPPTLPAEVAETAAQIEAAAIAPGAAAPEPPIRPDGLAMPAPAQPAAKPDDDARSRGVLGHDAKSPGVGAPVRGRAKPDAS